MNETYEELEICDPNGLEPGDEFLQFVKGTFLVKRLKVERPVQEVSPIEFEFLRDADSDGRRPEFVRLTGEDDWMRMPQEWSRKTFREVTQDSVSRVLTQEQRQFAFTEYWSAPPTPGINYKEPDEVGYEAFQAGIDFGVKCATGCSLLESSEVVCRCPHWSSVYGCKCVDVDAKAPGEVQDNGEREASEQPLFNEGKEREAFEEAWGNVIGQDLNYRPSPEGCFRLWLERARLDKRSPSNAKEESSR